MKSSSRKGCGHRGCDHSRLIKVSEMQEGISEEEAACANIQRLERAFLWVIASLSVRWLLMQRTPGQRHHLPLVRVLLPPGARHTQPFSDLESCSQKKSDSRPVFDRSYILGRNTTEMLVPPSWRIVLGVPRYQFVPLLLILTRTIWLKSHLPGFCPVKSLFSPLSCILCFCKYPDTPQTFIHWF